MATWSASPDVEPPLRETVPLEARQKADLVLCDRLQDSHGWGLQAVLISSLILMSSAKTCAKLFWAGELPPSVGSTAKIRGSSLPAMAHECVLLRAS